MNNNLKNIEDLVNSIVKTIEYTSGFGPKTAVVFDIDGTLINENTYKPIESVVHLYNYVKFKGIKPFIITARHENLINRLFTIQQLNGIGVTNYERMYMKQNIQQDVFLYKKECRKNIFDSGYNVIFSIGDYPADIGEFGGLGYIIKAY